MTFMSLMLNNYCCNNDFSSLISLLSNMKGINCFNHIIGNQMVSFQFNENEINEAQIIQIFNQWGINVSIIEKIIY